MSKKDDSAVLSITCHMAYQNAKTRPIQINLVLSTVLSPRHPEGSHNNEKRTMEVSTHQAAVPYSLLINSRGRGAVGTSAACFRRDAVALEVQQDGQSRQGEKEVESKLPTRVLPFQGRRLSKGKGRQMILNLSSRAYKLNIDSFSAILA